MPSVSLPMDQGKPTPWELLKRAAFNQYNAIAVSGVGLFALASGSWLPLVVGAGAEVLWLVLGSDSAPFRRWVDAQKTREAREQMEREIDRLLRDLGQTYASRFFLLKQMSEDIEKLARENKGLEALLLREEMAKLGQLLHSFLKMAATHQRLSKYLAENQAAHIEADIAACQKGLAAEADPRVQASLRQALSLAQKRLRQYQQIEASWKALSVQMVTLEKAFDYLKSNILGMGTLDQLARELDGLVGGVASAAELEAFGAELEDRHTPTNAIKAASRQNRARL